MNHLANLKIAREMMLTVPPELDLPEPLPLPGGESQKEYAVRCARAYGAKCWEAQQAKIDALMFEFCPEEMTQEQIIEWGKHQRSVPSLKRGGVA